MFWFTATSKVSLSLAQLTEELKQYEASPRVKDHTSSPFQWWNDDQTYSKLLHEVAFVVISFPVERVSLIYLVYGQS